MMQPDRTSKRGLVPPAHLPGDLEPQPLLVPNGLALRVEVDNRAPENARIYELELVLDFRWPDARVAQGTHAGAISGESL
jgi:hypothetical protein